MNNAPVLAAVEALGQQFGQQFGQLGQQFGQLGQQVGEVNNQLAVLTQRVGGIEVALSAIAIRQQNSLGFRLDFAVTPPLEPGHGQPAPEFPITIQQLCELAPPLLTEVESYYNLQHHGNYRTRRLRVSYKYGVREDAFNF